MLKFPTLLTITILLKLISSQIGGTTQNVSIEGRYIGGEACSPIKQDSRDPSRVYRKHANSVVYMNFRYYNGTAPGTLSTLTASFYPTVDSYSLLNIPNSARTLIGGLGDVSFKSNSIYIDFLTNSGVMRSSIATFAEKSGRIYYVPARTVVITLDNGSPVSIEWAPSNCIADTCKCMDPGTKYAICGELGVGEEGTLCDGTNCNIQVYLAWAGTDANGRVLASASKKS
ncbi:hypothetical protein HK099_002109 [Clydaea vesicula]|uniref:Uncharacterized protein n=1 Tax=Clydaea vesicula TaxID=447962 RepID=A0AAD5U7A1_9FUNG|nr:hypothetical protein HK099_002109 [Clydaea vesicula]KAJ3383277.1 hypothetical protein HDU92_004278 [Lobulomyces angularis]